MKNVPLSFIFLMLLAGSLKLSAQETKAVDLMSKALYEENINADFNKASLIYQQVVKDFSQDKKACAQATYRLGLCSEKLGQAKAQEYFISVIENYPDQQELVALARAKLNKSGKLQMFTDSRDGRDYKYINIGRLDWMAENLAYLPRVSKLSEQGGIWVYGFDSENIEEAKLTENYNSYGCLYDWQTAIKSCPEGWHLPSDDEWFDMERYYGYGLPESNNLRPKYGQESLSLITIDNWPSGSLRNNFSQMSIKPAGFRAKYFPDFKANYVLGGGGTAYWTSSRDSQDLARNRQIGSWLSGNSPQKSTLSILMGYSVRCVRNHKPEVVDREPPKIRAIEPASGSTLLGIVPICVIVRENNWMDRVELTLNVNQRDSLLLRNYYYETATMGTLSRHYVFDWDTRKYMDGNYRLTITAFDIDGNSIAETIEYTIKNHFSESPGNGLFVDIRDGKSYKTIKVGQQTWMGENLNYRFDENVESFCYNDRESNCDVYGRLYTFDAAKKVCPLGWHLPTDQDWKTLEFALGIPPSEIENNNLRDTCGIGNNVKSVSGWFRYKNYQTNEISTPEGNNTIGFNILAGGEIDPKYYSGLGECANYWTSTKIGKYQAWTRSLWGFSSGISRNSRDIDNGAISVRCIKDPEPARR